MDKYNSTIDYWIHFVVIGIFRKVEGPIIEVTHHRVSKITMPSRMLVETWGLQHDKMKAKPMSKVSRVMTGNAMWELELKGANYGW